MVLFILFLSVYIVFLYRNLKYVMSLDADAVLPVKSSAVTVIVPAPVCFSPQYALNGDVVSSLKIVPSSANCTLNTPESESLADACTLNPPIIIVLPDNDSIWLPNRYSPSPGADIDTLGELPVSIWNVGVV